MLSTHNQRLLYTVIDRVTDPTICLMPEVTMICVGIRLRHLYRLRSMNLERSYERNGLFLSAFSPSFSLYVYACPFNNPLFLLLSSSFLLLVFFSLCNRRRSKIVLLLWTCPCMNARSWKINDSPRSFMRPWLSFACVCASYSSVYNNDPLGVRLVHVIHIDERIFTAVST